MNDSIAPRLLTVNMASVYLSMPKATIYTKVCRQEIPPQCIVRISRKLLFDRLELDKWIESSKS